MLLTDHLHACTLLSILRFHLGNRSEDVIRCVLVRKVFRQ